MATSTQMCTSFKSELLSAGHCFNAVVTPTASVASANTAMTAVSAMTGIAVGMPVTGSGIAANTVVAAIVNSTALTLSLNTTAIVNSTVTFSGDVFKMALVKQGMTGTYNSATTNYSQLGVDEVTSTASGYTTGGYTLANISPQGVGAVAFLSFATNPSWSSATFSTAGCMIYNSSVRNAVTGAVGTGRSCSIHDFGGSQQVSSGTFTVLMPTNDSNQAILRIA